MLGKLVRIQPRSLSSFRLQASRTLSVAAARLHRPSLTRAVPSSWSPGSMRYFSTEPEGNNMSRNDEMPPSKSLFVGNIPWDANDEQLREVLSPYGAIDNVSFYPDPRGGHKGCARVDFNKLEDAIAVQASGQAEPFFLMERNLVVEFAKKVSPPKNHILFFRDFSGKEEDLRLILEDYKDHIYKITFATPLKEGHVWDRGHIFFGTRDADIAEEVLNKFNGKMTAMGCRLNLQYVRKRNRSIRSGRDGNYDSDSY